MQAVPDYCYLCQYATYAYNSLAACVQTYLLSRYLLQHKIPGCFVECGVANGTQLACMARAMLRENDPRLIHAFDSFQGIPHAGPKDNGQPGSLTFLMDRGLPLEKRLTSSHITACSLDRVQRLWANGGFPNAIEWHEGWLQRTLPESTAADIAFLRLDVDLYESYVCCLQHLYDKVTPGGIVYVDDFGLGQPFNGTQAAVKELVAERGIQPAFMNDPDTGTGSVYWFKS